MIQFQKNVRCKSDSLHAECDKIKEYYTGVSEILKCRRKNRIILMVDVRAALLLLLQAYFFCCVLSDQKFISRICACHSLKLSPRIDQQTETGYEKNEHRSK